MDLTELAQAPGPPPADRGAGVHPAFARIAAYCWRIIVVAVVALAALWLLRRVRVVFIPVVIALFLSRALTPVAAWLRRHGFRPGLAAITSVLGFFLVVTALIAVTVPSFADELDSIGPTLTQAVDDVEDWVVEDGPIDISRESFDRFRENTARRLQAIADQSGDAVADRATVVAEALTAAVLSVILTFFMVRDGAKFAAWVRSKAPAHRRAGIHRGMDAAWSTLAGYLRGATALGVLEAVVIGVTMLLAGGSLIAPVMMITFLAAYIPMVGAVLAGLVAVMVALVTGGTAAAAAVAVVALLVQQFDNDLLAPIIYGRALSLHPVTVLLSIVAGGALFGIAGTLLAVPVVAVVVNATREVRHPAAPTSAAVAEAPG